MSNNGGIQDAREGSAREKGLEGDFLRGAAAGGGGGVVGRERNCHIIRLVIPSRGMRHVGVEEGGRMGGRAGGVAEALGLAGSGSLVHDGGVSTKIINPEATEGGGSVCSAFFIPRLFFWFRRGGGFVDVGKRDTAARLGDCRGRRWGG